MDQVNNSPGATFVNTFPPACDPTAQASESLLDPFGPNMTALMDTTGDCASISATEGLPL